MSTRCSIIVRSSNEERIIYHHCDGYPEGVGNELRKNIIPEFIKTHTEGFNVDSLYLAILDFSDEYEEETCIPGDIEYLYILDVFDDEIQYQCIDVPCLEKYNYNTMENCEVIETDIFELDENIESNAEQEDEYIGKLIDNTIDVLDDAKNALKYLSDRNGLIDLITDKVYKENMTKDEFNTILKHFYDLLTCLKNLNL